MKKVLLLIVLFLININVLSQDYFFYEDFGYILDEDGNAVITAYIGNASKLIIPSTIDNHKVIEIGRHAFDESHPYDNLKSKTSCSSINQLIISDGIEKIDDFAFLGCKKIKSVKLPNSLTYLGMQSFLQCSSLNDINIPNKLKILLPNTFQETGLEKIIIPKNIEEIQDSVFSNCKRLTSVLIHNDNINFSTQNSAGQIHEYQPFRYSNNVILYGNSNSNTEKYAKKNGITFKSFDKNDNNNETIKSIKLDKNNLVLSQDEVYKLSVSFIDIDETSLIWKSDNNSIAIVENGKVTTKNIGNTVITVTTIDGKYTDKCNITVDKKEENTNQEIKKQITLNKSILTLEKGKSEKLIVNLIPANLNEKLIWSSNDTNIVSVNNGVVSANEVGNAIISVENLDGSLKAICNIKVIEEQEVEKETETEIKLISLSTKNVSLKVGESYTVKVKIYPNNVKNKELIWTTNNNYVSVDNGIITGLKAGKTTITVSDITKKTSSTLNVIVESTNNNIKQIKLDKNMISLNIGEETELQVSVLPSSASNKNLIWTTSNDNIKIDNGKIIALKKGLSTILVTSPDGKVRAICNVQITEKKEEKEEKNIKINKIVLNKNKLTLYKGYQEELHASILPTNSTDKELIWISDNNNIAIVENGVVIAKNIGKTFIIVSNLDNTINETCEVEVINYEQEKENFFDKETITIIITGVVFISLILILFIYNKKKN